MSEENAAAGRNWYERRLDAEFSEWLASEAESDAEDFTVFDMQAAFEAGRRVAAPQNVPIAAVHAAELLREARDSLSSLLDRCEGHDVLADDEDGEFRQLVGALTFQLKATARTEGGPVTAEPAGPGDALLKINQSHERAMYAARIDLARGDDAAAAHVLDEQLDGYDGPDWNGTETGLEWLERTRGADAAL